MLLLNATIRGAKKLQRDLKAESRRQKKSLAMAVRVEGFQLMRTLQREIRQGAPGGRQFKGLTYLARRFGGGKRMRPDKPLRRLAIGIRYHIIRQDPFEMRVGWTGPDVSKSWKRIAARQQKGFRHGMLPHIRKYFAQKAGHLSPRAAGRRQLMIRRSTRSFDTPARPIIDPFWTAHRESAIRNISRNYRLKMKGVRI